MYHNENMWLCDTGDLILNIKLIQNIYLIILLLYINYYYIFYNYYLNYWVKRYVLNNKYVLLN